MAILDFLGSNYIGLIDNVQITQAQSGSTLINGYLSISESDPSPINFYQTLSNRMAVGTSIAGIQILSVQTITLEGYQ
jgi:hypothetical protein